MFNTLRVARLVVLKAALPVPATVQICRHANHDASSWMGSVRGRSGSENRQTDQDILEDDLDMDPVEAKLEALLKGEKKRWKTTKFHKIRRQLSTRGAPERTLSWDAIEQIRYLKREFPEEWTVHRLAGSYSVTPDVISRILRSKFTPALERKLKQDCKVRARQLSIGHVERSDKGQSSLPVSGSTQLATLSSGKTGTLTCQSGGTLAKMEFETGLTRADDDATLLLRGTSQISAGPPVAQNTSQERLHKKEGPMDVKEEEGLEEEEEEENWDGVVFTEEELEDLVYTFHEKPSAVEQKGSEFYDSEGNFLYRI
ncbi:neugrin [Brachyhypopomus gauderio]|uniref:neugrin n=1 Tax=Brachyhypopomus gauderio TaxID=698409 RepID=UPI0040411CF1